MVLVWFVVLVWGFGLLLLSLGRFVGFSFCCWLEFLPVVEGIMSFTGSVLLSLCHLLYCGDITPVTAVMLRLIYRTTRLKSSLELEFLLAAMSGVILRFTSF